MEPQLLCLVCGMVQEYWDTGADESLAISVKHLQTKGDNDCLCLGDCFS